MKNITVVRMCGKDNADICVFFDGKKVFITEEENNLFSMLINRCFTEEYAEFSYGEVKRAVNMIEDISKRIKERNE